MDWLAPNNNRPTKNIEFYQRKALSFLFSSEGKDELRSLNIPFAQLGFYSPMHFLSLIPGEICEPYKSDRLFLASSGTVRKGDKVLLLEKDTEGIIKSAIFKEHRVRKNGETEILLDGHRQTYSEDEVVPYKTHLRGLLGTSLVPESDYIITEDGILDWEEPTWEPGQEVYYKPEKRWATILNVDEQSRGKTFVLIKLDATQLKREKTTTLSLKELRADSVPLRVPKRVHGDGGIIASSTGSSVIDDHSLKANVGSMEVSERHTHAMPYRDDGVRFDDVIENRHRVEHGSHDMDSGRGETIYAEVLPKHHPQRTRPKEKGIFSFANALLRKKPSKSRPVSEYYPQDPREKENVSKYRDTETVKSRSCNNLNASISDDDDDDDLEQYNKNYTNSLRSSARKIIQKQLARDSTRSASLKASSNSSAGRPHVAEIFTMSNSNTVPQPSSDMRDHDDIGIPIKPTRSKHLKRPSSMDNNLSSDKSQKHVAGVDHTKKPSIYTPTMMVQANAMASSSSSTVTQQCSRAPLMSTSQEYSRSSPLPSYLLSSPMPGKSSPLPSSGGIPVYSRDSRASPLPIDISSWYSRAPSPLPSSTTPTYSRSSPLPTAVTPTYSRSSPHPTSVTPSYSRSPPLPTTAPPYARSTTPVNFSSAPNYSRSSPLLTAAPPYARSTTPVNSSATPNYSRSSPLPIATSACPRSTTPVNSSAIPNYSRSSPVPTATPSRSAPIHSSTTPTNSRSSPLTIVTSQYSRASPVSMIIQQFNVGSAPASTAQEPEPETSTQQQPPRRFNHRPLPSLEYLRQKPKPNPLDYNFAPLSSSELVKKHVGNTVVNRVLFEPENNMSSDYVLVRPHTKVTEPLGVYSDSSSHDNDSGRGSYQYGADMDKPTEKTGCDMVYESSPKTRRHPTLEQSPSNGNAAVDTSYTEKSGTLNNNLQRRYTKNRALSKHNLSKYTNNNDDIDNDEENKNNMPHPFNPANLSHVAGYGKGIQGTASSSFADATLYALFACSNIFDKHLLFSKPGQVERGLKRDVRTILCNKIVTPLRLNGYCKSENITHLREAMLPLSSKMHSPLMDAEEFLYLLFDSALNIESFIELSNGSKDYIHQIIARPKDRSKSQTVQFMLETSLGTSSQKFKRTPMPALFLCMPRCKGRLVYYEAIIPSLQLNLTRLLHQGPKQCVCEMAASLECSLCHSKNGDIALDYCDICKTIADQIHFRLDHSPMLVPKSQTDEILNLHSIICTRGNRYVAFIKASEQRLSPWLFYDPMAGDFPEVTLLEDFGKWLDSLEKQPGSFREFAKLHPLLKRVMTDGHIYIYSRTHVANGKTFSESFAI